MSEKDICQKIFSLFAGDFTIRTEFRIKSGKIFDCLVYYKSIPYAIIELKGGIKAYIPPIGRVLDWKRELNCYWYVICDGERCLLNKGSETEFEKYLFSDAFAEIKNLDKVSNGVSQKAITKVQRIISKFSQPSFAKRLELIPSYYIDKPYVIYESEAIEDNFFQHIVGTMDKSKKEIHRYMSFKAAFETIKGCTYRMNGILGMNDKTEGKYLNNILGQSIDEEALNSVFISSFSQKEDDLTMWRLYGDDGKGVCMSFEIKSQDTSQNIHPIRYISEEDNCYQMLQQLASENFRFYSVEKWKCYFKPKEYEVEEEVRWIFRCSNHAKNYIKEPEYCIADGSSVINPFIILNLQDEDFPLQLTKITLGPKFKEPELNAIQFWHLLRHYKQTNDIEIKQSTKISYR